MNKTRFLMLGGFLGAGKTTAIARLARHYLDQGLRVALVTNDQAYGLVDTHALRAEGFDVGEVPGACFCCKFDELVETAAALGAEHQPDVILAEPVGSCTDLMATVVRPLRHLFPEQYDVAPLAVLCKPEHGRKILGGGSGGFSPQAAYIFSKQLEEAQVIVLNKIDRLSAGEREELLLLLHKRFAGKRVLPVSGTTGEGFDALIEALAESSGVDDAALEIEYDTYAEGEAALGWLNCSARVRGDSSSTAHWPLDELVKQLVSRIRDAAVEAELEPGHVKVLAASDGLTAVANWVASDVPVELSVASRAEVAEADLLANVRVQADPDDLALLVRRAIEQVADQLGLSVAVGSLQHFRPGRPEPLHRYESAVG